ncbi:uncharacterized protein [Montipora capricornis]|uniref:uncharacterized protein n=1 Tax=Montipora capricornis TaxID=246305 RepID=UPI0035F16EAB
MLHVRKSEKEFKYFAHTLLEHNDKIKRTAFVGGDRDKAQQGFLSPLRGCTFLPCKHVEDDIIRKLSDMSLNDMKMEVLKDIFGSDKDKEKGIVDSTDEDEFVAKVSSVADKWDGIEQRIHSGKEPQFSKYFRECIQEDMKEGMLLSTRRKAGLGDEFFFNNAQECSNFKYKCKILEEKMSTTSGYRPRVKCSWTEAIVLYRRLVEEVNRDKQRAVLQKGSFVLTEPYKHLEMPLHQWSALTSKEMNAHLAKVDPSMKGASNATLAFDLELQEPRPSDVSEETPVAIGSFEETGLPECLRGSWVNANKIVDLQGTAGHPNDSSKKVVISLSGPTTHTVQIGKNRKKLACDEHCPRFKEMAICCHTIAVAHNEGRLKEVIASYVIPVDRLLRSGIPGSTGKKANERGFKRKRQNNPPRDVAVYGDRVPVTAEDANEEANAPYEVVFVHSTSATTCYGCKGRVRDKPSRHYLPRHTIYLFAMKNVGCTTLRGKLELELALNLRWYTTNRYVLVPALTRMMWKRGDLLFQERSIVYLPRCIGVTFVRSSSWN